jgi:hypothetical protein
MNIARLVVAAILGMTALAAPAPPAAAQPPDLQPILDRFYPVDRLKPLTAAERQYCSAELATGDGRPTAILAGYTTRANGALRLLRRTAAGTLDVAFDSPEAWSMPGSRCVIRLRDLDFDGQPEALVYFQGVRASSGWIFKWDGTSLRNLTPTDSSDGRTSSLLLDPQLYDLDHSGPLEVIASRIVERQIPGTRSRNPAYVYGLTEAGYTVRGSLLAVIPYRADVDSRSNLRSFRLLEDSTAPYRLRVVNGDRFGRHRVAGATIRINEVAVLEPRDLTDAMASAALALPSLTVQNHVTAALTGPPDGTLLVLVEDATTR